MEVSRAQHRRSAMVIRAGEGEVVAMEPIVHTWRDGRPTWVECGHQMLAVILDSNAARVRGQQPTSDRGPLDCSLGRNRNRERGEKKSHGRDGEAVVGLQSGRTTVKKDGVDCE